MQSYSQNIRDQIYRPNVFSVDLIELHLISGAQYLCSGPYNISVDTDTAPNAGVNVYTAQGSFIQFGGISEDFDVKVGKLSIGLSGLTGLVSVFTDNTVTARRVVLYRCFLDLNTGAVVDSPIMLFDGQINNVSISEAARTASITIDCASLFADFERQSGRKTNNDANWAFQGVKYDTTFEKSGIVKNSDLLWGRTS
jgi:hypothetical protein